MKKKAEGLMAILILGLIAVIVILSLTIPTLQQADRAQNNREAFAYTTAPKHHNFTLAYDNIVSETFSEIPAGDYDLDTATGIIEINTSTNATYNISYSYYSDVYLSNTGERSLIALAIVGVLLGVGFLFFKGFGII